VCSTRLKSQPSGIANSVWITKDLGDLLPML
jgi:hypothetical protein